MSDSGEIDPAIEQTGEQVSAAEVDDRLQALGYK
jgi:hypothetical protein